MEAEGREDSARSMAASLRSKDSRETAGAEAAAGGLGLVGSDVEVAEPGGSDEAGPVPDVGVAIKKTLLITQQSQLGA